MRSTIAALENSLARKSDPELLADLQKRAATLGLQITITRLSRPQLTAVEGNKQEDNKGLEISAKLVRCRRFASLCDQSAVTVTPVPAFALDG
jgi:hypothetical protein